MALYQNQYKDTLDSDDDIRELEIKEGRIKPEEPKDEVEASPEMQSPAPTPEEETFKKRYGDARRHINKLTDEIKQLRSQVGELANNTMSLPTSEDEIDSWYKQYPDVAKIVEAIATKKAREQFSGLDEKLKVIEERERLTARDATILEIKKKHGDFDQITADRKFHEWMDDQPQWMQDAIYVNETDAKAAIRVFDLYKVDMGMIDKKPTKKPDASESVGSRSAKEEPKPNNGKRVWKESEIQRFSKYEWDKYEDEVYQARREGRIDYDLSRAAG